MCLSRPNRNPDPTLLARFDVVVTSYGIVKSEIDGAKGKKRKAPGDAKEYGIHAVRWRRVILDEAHEIRNRKTRAFKACKKLKATFRWCLTGTPVQNSAADIQSLFEFLRFSPLEDHSTFHRAITRPIRIGSGNWSGASSDEPQVRMPASNQAYSWRSSAKEGDYPSLAGSEKLYRQW